MCIITLPSCLLTILLLLFFFLTVHLEWHASPAFAALAGGFEEAVLPSLLVPPSPAFVVPCRLLLRPGGVEGRVLQARRWARASNPETPKRRV